MIPYRVQSLNSNARREYNRRHTKTRNVIERMFGMWKSKFQCINFKLTIKLAKSINVITACAVLWNYLLAENEIETADDLDAQLNEAYEDIMEDIAEAAQAGGNPQAETTICIFSRSLTSDFFAGSQKQIKNQIEVLCLRNVQPFTESTNSGASVTFLQRDVIDHGPDRSFDVEICLMQ